MSKIVNSNKTMIVATFCFIFITLSVGLTSIITSAQIINKEAHEKLLYLTQDKARELDNLLETPQATVEILKFFVEQSFSVDKFKQKGVPYTYEYLDSLEKFFLRVTANTPDIMGCYFVLSPELTKLNYFTEFWILDKKENGNFKIMKDNFPLTDLYPLTSAYSSWFYTPMITGKGGWTNPYIDTDINTSMISYSTPVYIEKQFAGVIGMDLSLKHMKKIISKLKTYNSGKIFLLDKNYNLVAGEDFSINLKESKTSVPKILLKAITINKKDKQIIEYNYNDTSYIASYTYLSNGFTLVITAPKSEILKQKQDMQLLVTGITMLGIILAIIIILNL